MHGPLIQLELPPLAHPSQDGEPAVRQREHSPRVPQGHLFRTELGPYLLLANGSRVFGIDEDMADEVARVLESADHKSMDALLVRYGLDAPDFVEPQPPDAFSVQTLSLAVAQKCNLGCNYCYAEGGDFGGPAKEMDEATAKAAVDRLLQDVSPGDRVTLAFMGGEPLINRRVLRTATDYAVEQSRMRDVVPQFSVTTNGTLVTAEDGNFFEEHGFAVTVSLDGIGEIHDRQRAFKGGGGSYDRIIERITPLLQQQRRMQVSARVTVTPENVQLRETLDGLISMGFHSVGFSPMLNSPTGHGAMHADQLDTMLEQMIVCGREFERRLASGQRYPFSNIVNALREIHRGTHRPYPCGAGAGYFGVSATGELSPCHRFVGDPGSQMGSLAQGVDPERQASWLAERHVHRQEPCRGCWARYLCGGGCHHEVIQRGRSACDYIRGWLHYCLQAYARLLDARPDYFHPEPSRDGGVPAEKPHA